MKTVSFSGNQVIFREGDAAETMYEIRSGRVGIFSSYGADGEKQIAVLNESQILGELGMIERCPRTATAVALSDDTTLAEYGEAELADFLRSRPDLVLTVLRQMSARIRDVNRKFNEACLALAENEAAVTHGEKKSDDLISRLEQISTEAKKQQSYSTSLRSSFFRYVMDDVEECKNYTVVKANIIERFLVKNISPYDLHANPDDEFAQPLPMAVIMDTIHNQYPGFTVSQGAKVQLGRVLSRRGFLSKELHNGIAYYVIPLAAA